MVPLLINSFLLYLKSGGPWGIAHPTISYSVQVGPAFSPGPHELLGPELEVNAHFAPPCWFLTMSSVSPKIPNLL